MLHLCLLWLSFNNHLMAAETPVVVVEASGEIRLGLPESILAHSEVKRHLSTGLTTSFVHRVTLRTSDGRSHESAVLVNVYYEPWEESWHVTTSTSHHEESQTFADYDAFAIWWRQAQLSVPGLPKGAVARERARVLVQVIPYSMAEKNQAQKWFTKSVTGTRRVQQGNQLVQLEASPTVFDMFMATSIKRQTLLDFTWKVAVVKSR